MTPEQNKNNFIKCLYLAGDQGYNPWAIYTHCYIESCKRLSDNSSLPWGSALCDSFNYAGMKFRPAMGSHYVQHDTTEYVDGKLVIAPGEKFQQFGTQYDFMANYLMKIKQFYPKSYDKRNDYVFFLKGLSKLIMDANGKLINDGWSTDIHYSETLVDLYEKLKDKGEFIEGSL